MHRRFTAFLVTALVLALALSGCSNPYKRKARSEADVAQQKAKIMADYRKCLDRYGAKDPERCEALRRATESM